MNRKITLSALALVLATSGAVAFAARDRIENDALLAMQAKVSLAQAITAAEEHVGGKAAKAEFEHDRKGSASGHYEVEVVKGKQVFDVRVDAEKGSVISSVEDKND